MVTRVGLVQSGFVTPFATTIKSSDYGSFNTQVGDFLLVFTRSNVTGAQTVSSAILRDGGSDTPLTPIDGASGRNINSRQCANAFYKVITTARTSDYVTVTYSDSLPGRELDVIIYRPGSGGTLSYDATYGVDQTIFTATTTTSPINTTGGGVLCSFVSGNYNDITSTSVSGSYTKFGTDTNSTSLAEKFSATALSSETVTWSQTSGNGYQWFITYDIPIKETGVATPVYEFASLNRGVGRGIARGIA
jgi:hypothetical protein